MDTTYSARARISTPPAYGVQDGPPAPVSVLTDSEHDGWVVSAEWSIIDGRPEPTTVSITRNDGGFVAADALRKVPIGRMLGESRTALTDLATQASAYPEVVALVGADLISPFAIGGRSQRGRELSDDKLDEVVQVYRRARHIGQPVNEAVRDAFHLSKDGAAKRIGLARKMLANRGEEL